MDDDKDAEARRGKFPDFACFRDLVLFEMKHLETDQQARLNDAYKRVVKPEEEPIFFGRRPMDFARLSNGDEIRNKIASKLAQTIETLLRKANSQFREYRTRNPRKNSISLCVVLNSTIEEFSPDVVAYSIHHKMKGADGNPRFSDIDGIIYISEKHARRLPDGRTAFAICNLVNRPAVEQYWKLPLIEKLLASWSIFRTGGEAAELRDGARSFDNIHDIPDMMPRSELWKLEYKRNPYLRHLSDHELKLHFTRCVAVNSVGFISGGWPQPSDREKQEGIRRFSDAIEEINYRGLDMRDMNPRLLSEAELRNAYAGLPSELLGMLLQGLQADGKSGS